MAEGTIQVELCSPDRAKQSLTVSEIICPGEEGIFTILPGHTPFLSLLMAGVIHIFDEAGQEQFYAVSGGFAEVRKDKVTILADAFEPRAEIDLERAVQAQERATTIIKKAGENKDILQAELAMKRALARIDAHKGNGHT